jgi:hypothetical protein
MRQIDDRLELEKELVALQRAMYVFSNRSRSRTAPACAGGNNETPFAGRLRVVHRDICIAQQLFGVISGL